MRGRGHGAVSLGKFLDVPGCARSKPRGCSSPAPARRAGLPFQRLGAGPSKKNDIRVQFLSPPLSFFSASFRVAKHQNHLQAKGKAAGQNLYVDRSEKGWGKRERWKGAITESPRRNILLMYLSLFTGLAFFAPLPAFGTSVHISFTFSSTCVTIHP